MNRRPYLLIICSIIVIGGLLSGMIAWFLLPEVAAQQLCDYVAAQMHNISSDLTVTDSIKTIIQSNLLDLLRIYLCGICLAGIPLLIIFVFLKMFSIGFICSILLQHSFVMLFTRMLYMPALIIATVFGCQFALKMLQNQLNHPVKQLVIYTSTFLGITCYILFVSILDGLSCYYNFIH